MKRLFIYSMLALSGFMLPACGDDEPEDDPTPASTHEGKWNTIKAKQIVKDQNWNTAGTGKDETLGYGLHVIEMSSQGAYKETFNANSVSGTYTKSNNVINLNIPQRLLINNGKHYLDSLTTSRMVLRDTVYNNGLYTITILTMVR